MYVLCFRGRLETVEALYRLEKKYNGNHRKDGHYIVCRTKKACRDWYTYHFGGEWKDRVEGVEILYLNPELYNSKSDVV